MSKQDLGLAIQDILKIINRNYKTVCKFINKISSFLKTKKKQINKIKLNPKDKIFKKLIIVKNILQKEEE